MKTTINTREKVAIWALSAGVVKSWREAYIIAYNGSIEAVTGQRSLPASVTRWKKSDPVTAEYQNALNHFKAIKNQGGTGEDMTTDGRGDNERTNGRNPSRVDYSDPTNQTRKLNELVNTASDPGEALDALKVIIQTQKADRDAAREGKQVKCYVPISCNDCPLYKKAKKG